MYLTHLVPTLLAHILEDNQLFHQGAASCGGIAAAIWGKYWNRTCVEFQSDKQAVVAALAGRSVCDPQLMHLC